MDRDKLNEAAIEYRNDANITTENFCPSDIEDAFMAGASWLMQQPLSERLTEEEKEKLTPVNRYVLETIFGPNYLTRKRDEKLP